jgi:hypothetical protein
MALPAIPSIVATNQYYQLALQALYAIANGSSGGGGGTGGNVTIVGALPAGSNTIGGVTLPTSSTSSVTTFTSTSSAQVLAANSSRKGIVFYNQGAGSVFVLLGTGTASATNFSVGLGTSDTVTVTGWTGAVQGIFSSAGTLNVTELS